MPSVCIEENSRSSRGCNESPCSTVSTDSNSAERSLNDEGIPESSHCDSSVSMDISFKVVRFAHKERVRTHTLPFDVKTATSLETMLASLASNSRIIIADDISADQEKVAANEVCKVSKNNEENDLTPRLAASTRPSSLDACPCCQPRSPSSLCPSTSTASTFLDADFPHNDLKTYLENDYSIERKSEKNSLRLHLSNGSQTWCWSPQRCKRTKAGSAEAGGGARTSTSTAGEGQNRETGGQFPFTSGNSETPPPPPPPGNRRKHFIRSYSCPTIPEQKSVKSSSSSSGTTHLLPRRESDENLLPSSHRVDNFFYTPRGTKSNSSDGISRVVPPPIPCGSRSAKGFRLNIGVSSPTLGENVSEYECDQAHKSTTPREEKASSGIFFVYDRSSQVD